jgi:hypothetical protein
MNKNAQKYIFASSILILMISLIIVSLVGAQEKNEISFSVDEDVFVNSVPRAMMIGEVYALKLYVKNLGNEKVKFLLIFFGPGDYIYPKETINVFELDRGETNEMQLSITPIKPHLGGLNVGTELYLVGSGEEMSLQLLHKKSAEILVIKKPYYSEEIFTFTLIFGFTLFFLYLVFKSLWKLGRGLE